jgi:hypothetical protein
MASNSALALPTPPPSIHNFNISHFISFELGISGKNFRKWRKTNLRLLARYRARHVEEETDAHLADDDWHDTDATISLWFIATIADDL